MTLLQPVLESLQATDRLGAGLRDAELQHLTAGNALTFLLENLLQVCRTKLAATSQGSGRDLADPLFTEAAAGSGELLENCGLQWGATAEADGVQQAAELIGVR
jgi:hypothetical protein